MTKFYLEKRDRYYEYLSRAKITMLYQQIDKSIRERISLSLRIKTPFVEAEARQRELQPNDYDMLKVVLSRLEENNSIGTVDEPRAYFAGELPLCWGKWDQFVYLGGRTKRTILGLGGSLHHLTSRLNTSLLSISQGSRQVDLARHLHQVLANESPVTNGGDDNGLVWWATQASALQRGDPQPMEFVARCLTRGETSISFDNWSVRSDFRDLRELDSIPIVVGSPLYVASKD